MFTKKAQRNRNQNKCLGELSLTSNFGFNFNKSVLDHILLYADLRHIILILIIIIIMIIIIIIIIILIMMMMMIIKVKARGRTTQVRSKLRN